MLRKHIWNTTVAVQVLKAFLVKETKVMKLKVRWWNIGLCHAPWDMGIQETVCIPADVWLRDWKPLPAEYRGGPDALLG